MPIWAHFYRLTMGSTDPTASHRQSLNFVRGAGRPASPDSVASTAVCSGAMAQHQPADTEEPGNQAPVLTFRYGTRRNQGNQATLDDARRAGNQTTPGDDAAAAQGAGGQT